MKNKLKNSQNKETSSKKNKADWDCTYCGEDATYHVCIRECGQHIYMCDKCYEDWIGY